MKIYEFIYNDSIFDGAATTISIHATEEGATQAMEDHKKMVRHEYKELYEIIEMLEDEHEDEAEYYTWHYGKYWGIRETELLP